MPGARIRHSGQRFPLVPPRLALRFAVGAAFLWLGVAGLGVYEYYQKGPAGEESLSHFAEWGVYAAGYTLVCLLFLPGLARVIVVGEGGVALECWGVTRWRLPWDQIRGWQRQLDTHNHFVGLQLIERSGRARRLSLGWLLLPEEYYEEILTASRRHTPPLEDLPAVRVFRVSSGCVFLLIAVVLFMAIYVAILVLSPP